MRCFAQRQYTWNGITVVGAPLLLILHINAVQCLNTQQEAVDFSAQRWNS
jgi:hypothetical protein